MPAEQVDAMVAARARRRAAATPEVQPVLKLLRGLAERRAFERLELEQDDFKLTVSA